MYVYDVACSNASGVAQKRKQVAALSHLVARVDNTNINFGEFIQKTVLSVITTRGLGD